MVGGSKVISKVLSRWFLWWSGGIKTMSTRPTPTQLCVVVKYRYQLSKLMTFFREIPKSCIIHLLFILETITKTNWSAGEVDSAHSNHPWLMLLLSFKTEKSNIYCKNKLCLFAFKLRNRMVNVGNLIKFQYNINWSLYGSAGPKYG